MYENKIKLIDEYKAKIDAFGSLSTGNDTLHKLADNIEITESVILQLHHRFYKDVNDEKAGKYRKTNVKVTGSEFVFPDYNEVPRLMKEFIASIPAMKQKYHPVEFAARLHEAFILIHPFWDGNGRTARILMNIVLIQAGYNVTAVPPFVRLDYLEALRECKEQDSKEPFVNFISEMVLESQKKYLESLNAQKIQKST